VERTDSRALAIIYHEVGPGQEARVATPTFPPADVFKRGGYSMAASPTLYPGQTVQARAAAAEDNLSPATLRLFVRVCGREDVPEILHSPAVSLTPGTVDELSWTVPDTDGRPVCEVGIGVGDSSGSGTIFLDRLTWDGPPRMTLKQPEDGSDVWRHAWVNAADQFEHRGVWAGMTYKILQNEGVGFAFQGEQNWSGYQVRTEVYPHLADEIGLMANVQGMRRYLALTLRPDGKARLILRHDNTEETLVEAALSWELDHVYEFALTTHADGSVEGAVDDKEGAVVRLSGTVAGERARGAVGLLVREGHGQFGVVHIEPAQ
jgi:hypothetical protein